MTDARANRIITFYSYKGGVGRSMAVANVAALLARLGRRVLVIDFDLEAPGIERYFDQPGLLDRTMLTGSEADPGLVDMLIGVRDGTPVDWRQCITEFKGQHLLEPIHVIQSGNRSSDYAAKAQSLNWDRLFAEHGLGGYLADLREQWSRAYDIVLIDSRTGVSDIGGICTILLPDALVMLFTANRQSIEGTKEVARLARLAQERLPVERARLQVIPLLSRDDRRTEYEQSEKWRGIVAEAMADFFREWVQDGVSPERVLSRLYLPQIAFWSFGERLPVIERPSELEDPGTLGAAYTLLARLIDTDLNWRAIDEETRLVLPEGSTTLPMTTPLPAPPMAMPSAKPGWPTSWVAAALLGLVILVGWAAFARWGLKNTPTATQDVAMTAPPAAGDFTIEQAQALISAPGTAVAQRIDALAFLVRNNAVPRNAKFDNIALTGKIGQLQGCVGCSFAGADLRRMTFDKGIFTQTSFAGARMDGASFIGATLGNVDFSGVDLSQVIFSGAQFSQTRIDGATLVRGQLTSEQLRYATGAPNWAAAPVTIPSTLIPKSGTQVIGGSTDLGWDVDIFWCEGAAANGNYAEAWKAAKALADLSNKKQALAPGMKLGRVRIKSLSPAGQKSGRFFLGAHYVTYDSGRGEADAAAAIAGALKAQTGAIYSVKPSVGAPTQWYISVIACAVT